MEQFPEDFTKEGLNEDFGKQVTDVTKNLRKMLCEAIKNAVPAGTLKNKQGYSKLVYRAMYIVSQELLERGFKVVLFRENEGDKQFVAIDISW